MSAFLRLLRSNCRPLFVSCWPNALGKLTRQQSTIQKFGLTGNRPFDINTSPVKDVILYKHENPRYYKMLNVFAISQFIFWSYLSIFSYTSLRDAPVEAPTDGTTLRWYERINLGENKYRNGITLITFTIGNNNSSTTT